MVRANALDSIAQQTIYVYAQTGSDTLGNGSAMNPFQTITHALSTITTNSTSNRFSIYLNGQTTETAIVLKPFVSLIGDADNVSQITVSGSGNNVTLDSTFLSATNPSASIWNINFAGSTNLLFDFTGGSATRAVINLISTDCNNLTLTGRGTTHADIINLFLCDIVGNVVITDGSIFSFGNEYEGSISSTSTNATTARFLTSQGDLCLGAISLSETSAATLSATINGGNITGPLTITGATATAEYDAISYPQSGISLVSSGTVSQFVSSPGKIPVTSITGATYTLTGSDYYLACNRSGAIALTFPTALGTGRTIIIKDVSGVAGINNITATSSGATFDGVATLTVNTNYGSVICTDTALNTWSLS